MEKYQGTVAYLNDLLTTAQREKGWVEVDDLVVQQPTTGKSFLVLKQERWDNDGFHNENDLAVPIDAQHVAAVRELLGLPDEQRFAMLKAGFYEEPEKAGDLWKEDDKLDAKHSGITKQLFNLLLSNKAKERYQSPDDNEAWWQKLEVATTEELRK